MRYTAIHGDTEYRYDVHTANNGKITITVRSRSSDWKVEYIGDVRDFVITHNQSNILCWDMSVDDYVGEFWVYATRDNASKILELLKSNSARYSLGNPNLETANRRICRIEQAIS